MDSARTVRFNVGGGLRADAPTYVEREADRELYNCIRDGQLCYIFNSRQMGKSSVRNRVAARLQQDGFCTATIDLSLASSRLTDEDWFFGIIDQLHKQLRLPASIDTREWWNAWKLLTPAQRYAKFITEVVRDHAQGRVIVFLDEIDRILSLGDWSDDFFSVTRAIYESHATTQGEPFITWVLIGVAAPADLYKNKTHTPFNIGTAIDLTGFTLKEAAGALVPGLGPKAEQPERVLEEILKWSGGQPFLTQKLCSLVARQPEPIPAGKEAEAVKTLVYNRIIERWESQDDPVHLSIIQNRVFDRENTTDAPGQQAGRLLGLYQRVLNGDEVRVADSIDHTRLRLTGLVVARGGRLVPFNPIYATVFDDAWVRRALAEVRPYAESLEAWLASRQTDSARLLRGVTLRQALVWAKDKNLSEEDEAFLRASEEQHRKEQEEVLAAERQAAEVIRAAGKRARSLGLLGLLAAALVFGLAVQRENRAQGKVKNAEAAASAASKKATDAEARLKAADARLKTAEARVRMAEAEVRAAEPRIRAAREREKRVAARAAQAEVRRLQAEKRVTDAEKRVAEAEKRARDTDRDSKTRFKLARAEVAAARKDLATAKGEAATARSEAVTAKMEVMTAQAKVMTAEMQLTTAKANLETATKQAESEKHQAAMARKQAEMDRMAATTARMEADTNKKKVDEQQMQLAAGEMKLADGERRLVDAEKRVREAEQRRQLLDWGLPDGISGVMAQLTAFRLENWGFPAIPHLDWMGQPTQLKALQVANYAGEKPAPFPVQLKELAISGSIDAASLPASLETLDLRGARIRNPASLALLAQLRRVTLDEGSSGAIQHLPPGITRLELEGTSPQSPQDLSRFEQLSELLVIEGFPFQVGEIEPDRLPRSLTRLELRGDILVRNGNFSSLPNLRRLVLSGSNDVPLVMSLPQSLEHLEIANVVPNGFARLQKLRKLVLTHRGADAFRTWQLPASLRELEIQQELVFPSGPEQTGPRIAVLDVRSLPNQLEELKFSGPAPRNLDRLDERPSLQRLTLDITTPGSQLDTDDLPPNLTELTLTGIRVEDLHDLRNQVKKLTHLKLDLTLQGMKTKKKRPGLQDVIDYARGRNEEDYTVRTSYLPSTLVSLGLIGGTLAGDGSLPGLSTLQIQGEPGGSTKVDVATLPSTLTDLDLEGVRIANAESLVRLSKLTRLRISGRASFGNEGLPLNALPPSLTELSLERVEIEFPDNLKALDEVKRLTVLQPGGRGLAADALPPGTEELVVSTDALRSVEGLPKTVKILTVRSPAGLVTESFFGQPRTSAEQKSKF